MANDDLSNITGLPAELGIDEALDKERTELRVRTDTRRYGKAMTVVSGFEAGAVDLRSLAKDLKRALATGGSAKDETIELQGDHAERVQHLLEERGFQVDGA